jgi:hypothetical protein
MVDNSARYHLKEEFRDIILYYNTKVLFTVHYTLFFYQIVWKFDLGLLNADNPMYLDINISEDKDGKKIESSSLSCVTKGEFYFNIGTYIFMYVS